MNETADELGAAGHAESLLDAFDRLLEARRPDRALELIVAAESGDVRAARLVVVELRGIHLGSGAATAATAGAASTSEETLPRGENAAAGVPHLDVTLAALRLAGRLRPHARGTLGSWEVTLLRSYLS